MSMSTKPKTKTTLSIEDFGFAICQLKVHEGYRSKPYHCTEGKLTVGYGFNLDAGMSEEEATLLLEYKVMNIITDMMRFKWFEKLDSVRKVVIINMVYQMGLDGVLKFKKMIKAIQDKDYKEASVQMMDSKWFRQTENRSRELAGIMKRGTYQTNSSKKVDITPANDEV